MVVSPQRTQISFAPFSPQFESELIALARWCITPRLSFVEPVRSPRCVCVPCRTCRAFSFVFLLLRPRAHCVPLRVLSHRARVLPSVQFICVPTAYVSAARPCALVRTVFHITSPLPLSRAANPLVTSICRVQLGCSGHPHIHISHPLPLLSRTVDDLTPSLTYLAPLPAVCAHIPQQDTSTYKESSGTSAITDSQANAMTHHRHRQSH